MSVLLPPSARSRAALGISAAAALGRLELQVCDGCGTVQYPPRDACVKCLSSELTWREHSGRGELLAATTVHHSNDAYFRAHSPWHIGMVRLEGDVTVIAHLHHACLGSRGKVLVRALLDRSGQGVLFAFPTEPERAAETDPQVLEMTCTPRQKRVLVTDGTSELGLSLIEGLLAAGAQTVWSGTPGSARAQAMPAANVLPLPLDVTAAASVAAAAQELGSKVDIVINNTEVHGASGAVADNLELAQAEINTNYIGLLRLASAFTPHLLSRTQGEDSRPTAWVNVLSIYALSTLPSHGTYCASKAAALSLAYNLRAQLRPSGIRVLNVFPGPIDDGAYRDLSQPKLAPRTLARAIVQALESGQEDCYPDDVAQERLQRWRQDPKLLELEPQP